MSSSAVSQASRGSSAASRVETEASSIGSRLRVADGSWSARAWRLRDGGRYRLFHIAGLPPRRRGPGCRPDAPAPRGRRRYTARQGFLRMLPPCRAPRDSSRTRIPLHPRGDPRMRTSRLFLALTASIGAALLPRRAGRRPDQHEDQHLDRPELAPGRGDRHLRPRSREAHRRPLQDPDVLRRLARRRARVGRGGAARHAGADVHLDRPGAQLRARGRDPRHPVPVPRLRPRALRRSTARSARTCWASSRPRASSRWPGARTAFAT